ncbi:MAG: T9SS type A sorting domain-containing protein [Bacteroidota bacterium]|nr:T9SS type A sorting domain-containing protein [Bacteroidota bacterium]
MNKPISLRFFLVLLIFITKPLFATHYRAGEITYRQIGVYTFEISATTYTDPSNSSADRYEIEIVFGDGTSGYVQRSNGNGEMISSDIKNLIKKNIYTTNHTYPGTGQYIVSITDPNRFNNIRNINNGLSFNIPFYIESCIKITSLGINHSPVFIVPPVDIGNVNKIFKHSILTFDLEGAELSYSLVPPMMAAGINVPNYILPEASVTFQLNANGEIYWEHPIKNGIYNYCIKISEFRNGILIGYVIREEQIFIANGLTEINQVEGVNFELFAYPNPANDKLIVHYTLRQKENLNFDIFNMMGEKVNPETREIENAGKHEMLFDLSTFKSGMYFLELTTEGSKKQMKFTVIR